MQTAKAKKSTATIKFHDGCVHNHEYTITVKVPYNWKDMDERAGAHALALVYLNALKAVGNIPVKQTSDHWD